MPKVEPASNSVTLMLRIAKSWVRVLSLAIPAFHPVMAETWNPCTGCTVTSTSAAKVGIGFPTTGTNPAVPAPAIQQKLSVYIAKAGTENILGQYEKTGASDATSKFRVGGGNGTADWAGMEVHQLWGTNTGNNLAFFAASGTSSIERFTVLGNGFVGVNTTGIPGGLPRTSLEVNGNGVKDGSIRISNGYFEVDGVDAAATASGGTNNLRIGYFSSGRVGVNLQGTEAMTFLTNGRVGVGTSTPSGQFHIHGNNPSMYMTSSQTDVNSFFAVRGQGDTWLWGWGGIPNSEEISFGSQDHNPSNKRTLTLSSGGYQRMKLDWNGSIGIGTTTPSAYSKLDVNGYIAVSGQSALLYEKESKTFMLGDIMGGDDAAAGGTGENIAFRTLDKEVARINGMGYLGLWTPTPRTEMEIHDSPLDADGRADLWLVGNTGSGGVLRYFEGAVERATIRGDATPGDLVFQTGGSTSNGPSEMARMTAAGDMVMAGSFQAGSIKTKTWSIAPDYVFEKDYKLASLEHVEKYLNENKHLPEIPSAKEIKENGLDLADMNLKLLKKVEELTLYSIQLEKRVQKLEGVHLDKAGHSQGQQ